MKLSLALLSILVLVGCVGGQLVDNNPITLGADSVNEINTRGVLFTARRYPYFESFPSNDLKTFLGAKDYYNTSLNDDPEPPVTTVPPTSFDISEKWPQCKRVFEAIQDQSYCASSWAVSTSSAISDRRCIRYNGTAGARISAWDLMSCCTDGRGPSGNGCDEGYIHGAFISYYITGVATGGPYGGGGCMPYLVAPGATSLTTSTYCNKTCQPSYTLNNHEYDRKTGMHPRFVQLNNTAVQQEIIKRGSVVTQFKVYQDFYQYSSGIYQHTTGALVGGHAVKIHGWGEENGVKYWKAANSWGSSWGENGFFRILRDVNECGFEEYVIWSRAYKN